jgi:hypothetical protein
MKFLIILILIPLIGFASPAEEPENNDISILESARDFLGDRANFAANQIDSFFATERADDELGRSRIRIRSQFLTREGTISDLNNQYRINLKLPNLEKKFNYEFNKKKETKPKNTGSISSQGMIKPKKKGFSDGWIFNSDIGVSVGIPPKLVTRARLRKNFEMGSFIHRFAEQITYITDESGWLEETSIDSDYILKSNLIFRFINYKRWRILQKDFRTNHGPTLLHRISENDALNYSTTAQSVIDGGTWYIENYRISLNYRKNIYRQWIYFDIIPGIDFPKINSFRRTPYITFQLELLFGSS